MSTKQHDPKPEESKKDEAGKLEAVVRGHVLSDLGRPAALHRVQVRRVFGNHYRVNVFVGPDNTTFTIAHSYFLEADGAGKILSSTPAITKAY